MSCRKRRRLRTDLLSPNAGDGDDHYGQNIEYSTLGPWS